MTTRTTHCIQRCINLELHPRTTYWTQSWLLSSLIIIRKAKLKRKKRKIHRILNSSFSRLIITILKVSSRVVNLTIIMKTKLKNWNKFCQMIQRILQSLQLDFYQEQGTATATFETSTLQIKGKYRTSKWAIYILFFKNKIILLMKHCRNIQVSFLQLWTSNSPFQFEIKSNLRWIQFRTKYKILCKIISK